MIAEIVYALCGLTSLCCAGLLFRSYQASRVPLLLWSTFCFAGLALSNIILFVDLQMIVTRDLSLIRNSITLISLCTLVYGLIWEVAE